MSGHSHWAGIKHKKAKVDAQRGKVFSRISKQIIAAARHGGKDPDQNLELRYAMDAARAVNMPRENVQRAILRGAGEVEGVQLEQVRYEGYGPGGAAVMVEALTDNRNRTGPHVRRILESHGGQLGGGGSVSWQFQRKGLVMLRLGDRTEDDVFEVVVEAGAEDFQPAGEIYELTCDAKSVQAVRTALDGASIQYESAQITMVPTSYVDLGANDGRKMLKLMEELEDDEDVTSVYSNFNLPEDLVAELESES